MPRPKYIQELRLYKSPKFTASFPAQNDISPVAYEHDVVIFRLVRISGYAGPTDVRLGYLCMNCKRYCVPADISQLDSLELLHECLGEEEEGSPLWRTTEVDIR